MSQATSTRAHWPDMEVTTLIDIFFGEKIQALVDNTPDNTARNKDVYKKCVEMMRDAGYERSHTELRTKINNLKAWYRRQTDRAAKPGKSGAARQIRHPIYIKLDEYLSDKPMTRPGVLLDSGRPTADDEHGDEVEDGTVDEDDGSQDGNTSEDENSQDESQDEGDDRLQRVAAVDTGMRTPVVDPPQVEDEESDGDLSDAESTTPEEERPGTSTGIGRKRKTASKAGTKQSTRRKKSKYDKALSSMMESCQNINEGGNLKFQEMLMEQVKIQQEWEERQREKDREEQRKFQQELMESERKTLLEFGAMLQTILRPQASAVPPMATSPPPAAVSPPPGPTLSAYTSQCHPLQLQSSGTPHRFPQTAPPRRIGGNLPFGSSLSDADASLNYQNL